MLLELFVESTAILWSLHDVALKPNGMPAVVFVTPLWLRGRSGCGDVVWVVPVVFLRGAAYAENLLRPLKDDRFCRRFIDGRGQSNSAETNVCPHQ
jgi:hypothetical protein